MEAKMSTPKEVADEINRLQTESKKTRLVYLAGLAVFIAVIAGGLYYYNIKQSVPSEKSSVTGSTEKMATPSASSESTQMAESNPNTGTVYGDIKKRMVEVLK